MKKCQDEQLSGEQMSAKVNNCHGGQISGEQLSKHRVNTYVKKYLTTLFSMIFEIILLTDKLYSDS